MSGARKDGGPAFPTENFDNMRERPNGFLGMSLRDYFAGQALTGLCANMGNERFVEMSADHMADVCFLYADAMIAERSK